MAVDKKEIIRLVDIAVAIGKRIKLKREGPNYSGLCPFHKERSGSFKVSPGKKIYKCFGCGRSGDVIKFIEDFEHLDFKEAVRQLAIEFNIDDPEKEIERIYDRPEPRREPITGEFFNYLVNTRKISAKTINKLRIVQSEEYMIKLKDTVPVIAFGYYRSGQPISYKFRVLDKAIDMQLTKNCELIPYNVDSIANAEEVCIAEGEIDCATLVECGILESTSCPNGAGSGVDWVGTYYNHKKKIYLFTDADAAGEKMRAKLIRRLGYHRCYGVSYPEGCKDINEVLQKFGSDAVRQVKASAQLVTPPALDSDENPLQLEIQSEDPDASMVRGILQANGTMAYKAHLPGIIRWANSLGFSWMRYADGDQSPVDLVRLVDNILYHATDQNVIHEFTKEIDLNYGDNQTMRNMLYGVVPAFKTMLISLPFFEAPILFDTKDISYIYFNNGILAVTKEACELIAYKDIPAAVWSKYIINHDYTQSTNQGNFYSFLQAVSIDEGHYSSILSNLGYLLHNYKLRTTAKAILIVENVEDETEARGRSGKGLIAQFIELFRCTVQQDGRNYKQDDKFKLQRVDISTQIFYINDPASNLLLNQFYNMITDDFLVERKGMQSYIIPFKRSPKLLITTNHLPALTSDSDRERFAVMSIKKTFGATYKLRDMFPGVLFFDKDHWPENEFNACFQLAVEALQIWLGNGLVPYSNPEMEANEAKRLITAIVPDYISEVMDQVIDLYKACNDHITFENALHAIDLEPFSDSIQKAFYWSKEGLDVHMTYYYRYVLRAYKPKTNQVWFGKKLRFYLEKSKMFFEERRSSSKGRKVMIFRSGMVPDLFSGMDLKDLEQAPF